MDASCKIQRSIHDVRLTYKYVSRILGTYHSEAPFYIFMFSLWFHKFLQFIHKCTDILEFSVDRSKANISNCIQVLQMFHDNLTNAGTGNFFVCCVKNISLYRIHQRLDLFHRNRSLIAGTQNSALNLGTVILFTCLILLNDTQWNSFNFFVCRKSFSTGFTHSPSPD